MVRSSPVPSSLISLSPSHSPRLSLCLCLWHSPATFLSFYSLYSSSTSYTQVIQWNCRMAYWHDGEGMYLCQILELITTPQKTDSYSIVCLFVSFILINQALILRVCFSLFASCLPQLIYVHIWVVGNENIRSHAPPTKQQAINWRHKKE